MQAAIIRQFVCWLRTKIITGWMVALLQQMDTTVLGINRLHRQQKACRPCCGVRTKQTYWPKQDWQERWCQCFLHSKGCRRLGAIQLWVAPTWLELIGPQIEIYLKAAATNHIRERGLVQSALIIVSAAKFASLLTRYCEQICVLLRTLLFLQ